MELDEFIKSALVQIVRGTKGADQELGGNTIANGIATGTSSDSGFLGREPLTGELVNYVNFDAALTVESSSGKGGKIGVVGFNLIKAEGGAKSDSSSSMVSRIQFCIPLKMGFSKTKR